MSVNPILKYAKNRAKLLIAVTTATAVGVAGGAVVMAAIPDSNGVIHACYKTGLLSNGAVRIIDSSANCSGNETAINWDQHGGAKSAYAQLNSDGTINSSFSSNINDVDIVDTVAITGSASACYKVNFTPRDGTAYQSGAATGATFVRGRSPTDVTNLDLLCGSSYNAVVIGVLPTVSTDPSEFSVAFFN